MITLKSLPETYHPLHQLVLCSNTLLGDVIPFEVNGKVPLLVGAGVEPRLWLSGSPDAVEADWLDVVVQNQPTSKTYPITVDRPKRGTVRVRLGDTTIVVVRQRAPNRASVTLLDLRALGLDVEGDTQGLRFFDKTFQRHTIKGVNVAFGMKTGGPNAPKAAKIELVHGDDRHVVLRVTDADQSPDVTHNLYRHTSSGFTPPEEGTLVLEDVDVSKLPAVIEDGPSSLSPPKPDTQYFYNLLSVRRSSVRAK